MSRRSANRNSECRHFSGLTDSRLWIGPRPETKKATVVRGWENVGEQCVALFALHGTTQHLAFTSRMGGGGVAPTQHQVF